VTNREVVHEGPFATVGLGSLRSLGSLDVIAIIDFHINLDVIAIIVIHNNLDIIAIIAILDILWDIVWDILNDILYDAVALQVILLLRIHGQGKSAVNSSSLIEHWKFDNFQFLIVFEC
jgi:hypothetical protein